MERVEIKDQTPWLALNLSRNINVHTSSNLCRGYSFRRLGGVLVFSWVPPHSSLQRPVTNDRMSCIFQKQVFMGKCYCYKEMERLGTATRQGVVTCRMIGDVARNTVLRVRLWIIDLLNTSDPHFKPVDLAEWNNWMKLCRANVRNSPYIS